MFLHISDSGGETDVYDVTDQRFSILGAGVRSIFITEEKEGGGGGGVAL